MGSFRQILNIIIMYGIKLRRGNPPDQGMNDKFKTTIYWSTFMYLALLDIFSFRYYYKSKLYCIFNIASKIVIGC